MRTAGCYIASRSLYRRFQVYGRRGATGSGTEHERSWSRTGVGVELEFSEKYHDQTFPGRYAAKHQGSFSRRLNDRREKLLLDRCLTRTDSPASIVDVGCGPGRFWPVIAKSSAEDLWGLDVSQAMLQHAINGNGALGERFQTVAGSVMNLPFQDSVFDCVATNF